MPTFRDDFHSGHKVPLIENDDLADGCITEEKLADGCVTADKVDKDSVATFEDIMYMFSDREQGAKECGCDCNCDEYELTDDVTEVDYNGSITNVDFNQP